MSPHFASTCTFMVFDAVAAFGGKAKSFAASQGSLRTVHKGEARDGQCTCADVAMAFAGGTYASLSGPEFTTSVLMVLNACAVPTIIAEMSTSFPGLPLHNVKIGIRVISAVCTSANSSMPPIHRLKQYSQLALFQSPRPRSLSQKPVRGRQGQEHKASQEQQ